MSDFFKFVYQNLFTPQSYSKFYIPRVSCLQTVVCYREMSSKELRVQGLFSESFKNWDWLWKKYHISLFLVSDRELTDSLFLLFLVNSFGTRRLIRN